MKYTNAFGDVFTSYEEKDFALKKLTKSVVQTVQEHGYLKSNLCVGFMGDTNPSSYGTGCYSMMNNIENGRHIPVCIGIPNNLLVDEEWKASEVEFLRSCQRFSKDPITPLTKTIWSILHEIGHAIDNENERELARADFFGDYQNKVNDENSYFDIECEVSATLHAVKLFYDLDLREDLIQLQNKYPELRETEKSLNSDDVVNFPRVEMSLGFSYE